MSDDCTLLIAGQRYGGWKSVRVQRSIESVSGAFEVKVSERWPGQASRHRIRQGSSVAVAIGTDTVITGYVDEITRTLKDGVTITGRDKTGDLVDSAPDLSPGEWYDITVEALAKILCEPFGIPVRSELGRTVPFEKIALNPGSKAWALLEERCRYRGAFPISDGMGGLALVRAGSARTATALVEGQNILDGSLRLSWRDRFNEIIVKGQSQGIGFGGATAAEPEGKARDAEIDRHRPQVVVARSGVDAARAKQLAQWEVTVRAGRGARVTIVVQGWRQSTGALWPINALVPVRSGTLGINESLLISGVEYTLDENGTRTTLSLVRPDAFALLGGEELPTTQLGYTVWDAIGGMSFQDVTSQNLEDVTSQSFLGDEE